MKILVTGGAGFIGSHLAEKLVREGHQIAIIDDLNDFYAPEDKRTNLHAVSRAGSFCFHHADIVDTVKIAEIVARELPDIIIHLAARAGVRPSLAQPFLYEQVNVHGTMGLLEACRRSGVPKFIFASSSSIYGVANQVPFSEGDHRNFPISPYAATKLAGEKICFTYSHLYDIRTTCLRFFTVYGPRQRPDLAIRKFTGMIECGQPIPLFGDGSSGRDYTYVDDTIAGIRASIDYDTPYDVFNLGNSHPINLNTMVQTIEAAVGRKAHIERLPDQPGDVPITFADISKARRLLNYDPKTPFSEGIRKFVAWCRETRLAPMR
jgi:UDP-glucuronate 4-epimerase